jgi:hypothetical protein
MPTFLGENFFLRRLKLYHELLPVASNMDLTSRYVLSPTFPRSYTLAKGKVDSSNRSRLRASAFWSFRESLSADFEYALALTSTPAVV